MAMAAWIQNMPDYYERTGAAYEVPSWAVFADIIQAATNDE